MVSGFTGLLRNQYQGRLDAKADEYIGFAADAATRMQRLIDDLLAYARVGRDKTAAAVDVNGAVDRALENLRTSIEEAGARVTRDLLPTVQANALELAQLFQNLIGNAIKFRREGVTPEIHIGVKKVSGVRGQETGSRRLEAAGPADRAETGVARQSVAAHLPFPDTRTLNADAWLFTIRDNGIGIDPQYADRIFAIFQRLHTRDEYPGSGVGLAICKKIVERHGGRIWVESIAGKESTFCFTIPTDTKSGGT